MTTHPVEKKSKDSSLLPEEKKKLRKYLILDMAQLYKSEGLQKRTLDSTARKICSFIGKNAPLLGMATSSFLFIILSPIKGLSSITPQLNSINSFIRKSGKGVSASMNLNTRNVNNKILSKLLKELEEAKAQNDERKIEKIESKIESFVYVLKLPFFKIISLTAATLSILSEFVNLVSIFLHSSKIGASALMVFSSCLNLALELVDLVLMINNKTGEVTNLDIKQQLNRTFMSTFVVAKSVLLLVKEIVPVSSTISAVMGVVFLVLSIVDTIIVTIKYVRSSENTSTDKQKLISAWVFLASIFIYTAINIAKTIAGWSSPQLMMAVNIIFLLLSCIMIFSAVKQNFNN